MDDELKRAAAASGLEKLLDQDPEAFKRAYQAAAGYAERRAPVGTPALEPAHVFRPVPVLIPGQGKDDD